MITRLKWIHTRTQIQIVWASDRTSVTHRDRIGMHRYLIVSYMCSGERLAPWNSLPSATLTPSKSLSLRSLSCSGALLRQDHLDAGHLGL